MMSLYYDFDSFSSCGEEEDDHFNYLLSDLGEKKSRYNNSNSVRRFSSNMQAYLRKAKSPALKRLFLSPKDIHAAKISARLYYQKKYYIACKKRLKSKIKWSKEINQLNMQIHKAKMESLNIMAETHQAEMEMKKTISQLETQRHQLQVEKLKFEIENLREKLRV